MLFRAILKHGEAAALDLVPRLEDEVLNGHDGTGGATALHYAAAAGYADLCWELLESPHFFVLNEQDCQGCTALHYAASKGQLEVCHVLLEHLRFTAHNAQDWHGWTALHAAAAHGQKDLCVAILQSPRFKSAAARDKDGMTALHFATSRGHGEICEELLQHEAFLGATYVDNFGRTVHCMRGRQPVTAEPVRERSPAKPSLQATAEAKAKVAKAKAEAKRLSAAEKLRSLMHWSEKLKEMLPKEANEPAETEAQNSTSERRSSRQIDAQGEDGQQAQGSDALTGDIPMPGAHVDGTSSDFVIGKGGDGTASFPQHGDGAGGDGVPASFPHHGDGAGDAAIVTGQGLRGEGHGRSLGDLDDDVKNEDARNDLDGGDAEDGRSKGRDRSGRRRGVDAYGGAKAAGSTGDANDGDDAGDAEDGREGAGDLEFPATQREGLEDVGESLKKDPGPLSQSSNPKTDAAEAPDATELVSKLPKKVTWIWALARIKVGLKRWKKYVEPKLHARHRKAKRNQLRNRGGIEPKKLRNRSQTPTPSAPATPVTPKTDDLKKEEDDLQGSTMEGTMEAPTEVEPSQELEAPGPSEHEQVEETVPMEEMPVLSEEPETHEAEVVEAPLEEEPQESDHGSQASGGEEVEVADAADASGARKKKKKKSPSKEAPAPKRKGKAKAGTTITVNGLVMRA